MPRLLGYCLSVLGLTVACNAAAGPAPGTGDADALTKQQPPTAAPIAIAADASAPAKPSDTAQPASCAERSGACDANPGALAHAFDAQHAEPSAACGDHGSCASCGEASGPGACGSAHGPETASETPPNLNAAALTRIGPHGGVCMLSNRYLGERADVPIDVAGKTYHGCCANCAARLAANEELRTATDPVSGNRIDKATAVLARDASNRVHYFESEQTLAQFSAQR